MPCYHPLQAYQSHDGLVFFSERKGKDSYRSLQLACGQCVGCRLERSRQWAVRCVHEASLHEHNCFITLTYADAGISLVYDDFQRFLKRLRKAHGKVRFFVCGEYGELNHRPHFHACLFGIDFKDKVYLATTASGARLFRSPALEVLWPFGFSSLGSVTFESAAYVARYVMKKITGDAASAHYSVVDKESGEVLGERLPEFCHMSLKPGIGARWLDKYVSDVYPGGMVVVNGVQVKPPKYYDRRYRRLNRLAMEELDFKRDQLMRAQFADNTEARLAVKEVVVTRRVGFLKRSIS